MVRWKTGTAKVLDCHHSHPGLSPSVPKRWFIHAMCPIIWLNIEYNRQLMMHSIQIYLTWVNTLDMFYFAWKTGDGGNKLNNTTRSNQTNFLMVDVPQDNWSGLSVVSAKWKKWLCCVQRHLRDIKSRGTLGSWLDNDSDELIVKNIFKQMGKLEFVLGTRLNETYTKVKTTEKKDFKKYI